MIDAAAFEGHDDVLKLLLEAGANKDALTDDKRTPLFQAAFRGHLDSVRVLLEYGADCTIKNSEEKSPADVAENEDVVTLLTEQPTKKARTEE